MFTLNANGRLMIVDKPIVMGILNCTPDSFYAESRVILPEIAIGKAAALREAGASIIDVGGQSSRPGSRKVDEATEASRVIPIIKALAVSFPDMLFSVDTYYSSVARKAVAAGASVVNDISAGRFDENMLSTVATLNVPYICMHMKGEPANMQEDPHYADVTLEVIDFFVERIAACRKAGIKDIILDPGFGFGKSMQHNFRLLQQLDHFAVFDLPVMAGLSRKSIVYRTLGCTPEEALNGSTVLNTIALLKGVHMLRVHDVQEAVEAVQLVKAYHESAIGSM